MPRTLILIDGMAVIYRAFFAIRNLSSPDGRPTNAVFGFIRMLRQMKEVWNPTHWTVVFDGGTPEQRLELLPDYKAQRDPMPDDLKSQIDVIEDYLARRAIPLLKQDAQEADDVVGSCARIASADCQNVLIATGDKDLYQLVDEKTVIVPVSGDGGAMGSCEVKAKTGVMPEQIVEWLALMGDSADNIPGVPGVGNKTAAMLLNQFGSLSEMWARMDEIKRDKLKNALLENRAIVERNIQMMTLNLELVDCFDWDAAEISEADPSSLLSFFDELGFDSFSRELRQPELL